MRLLVLYSRYLTKRILIILYLAIFVGLFLVLRSPFFDLYYIQIANPFYGFFAQWSTFIYTILIIVIFGFATTILEMILAFFNSTAQVAITKRKAYIHKYINETLFEHLTSERDNESDQAYIRRFKRKFRTDYPRLVFINRLRRIMLLSTGEVNEHCKRLFILMKANWLIRAYLNSPYARHKLFALILIGEFDLSKFSPKVKRLMKSSNRPIASEALYAYIRLNTETDFRFLIKRNKPLSKLEFNKIVIIANNYQYIDYESLITSKMPMISALGISFAAKHQVQSMKDIILKRIDHNDEDVRNEAQKSFLVLMQEDDVPVIFDKFDVFTTKNKLKIITMLGEYSNNAFVVKFLHSIIESAIFDLKLVAMNILIQNNTLEVLRYRNHADMAVCNVYKQLTDFNM